MPYKVTEMSDGAFRVFVYDANHPTRDDLYVSVRGEAWTYQPPPPPGKASSSGFAGNAATKSLELTPWSVRNMQKETYFDCPFCKTKTPDKAPIEVVLAGEGELLIANRPSNQPAKFAGFDPDKDAYVNDFSVDTASFKGGLDEDVPDLYRLPADPSGYSVYAFDPFREGETGEPSDLSIASAGVTIVMEGLELEGGQVLDVLIKNTGDGPLLRVAGLDSSFVIPAIIIADDGDEASYEFEFTDVVVSPDVGLEIGLSNINNSLLFRRWRSTDKGPAPAESDTSYQLVATRIDALGDSVLTVPEILVRDNETVFFDRGEWQPDSPDAVQVKATDIPIYIIEDVDIITILEDGASRLNERKELVASRIPKNGTGFKRNRKTFKQKSRVNKSRKNKRRSPDER